MQCGLHARAAVLPKGTQRRRRGVCARAQGRESESTPFPLPLPPNPFDLLLGNSTLQEGIASFYDESTPLWENMWGDHLHHGYYPGGIDRDDHRQAQVDMIDRSLEWAGVTEASRMVDVGCGVGGSSRHIARKFGASSVGLTLSPLQVKRAQQLSDDAELPCTFEVGDALEMPFEDGEFDLVWSMESGEHMPDKAKFTGELARVCAPGGRVLLVTWCHRELNAGETELPPDEQFLLDRICDAYYLPAWCPVSRYASLATELGLKDVRTADWSLEVQPFWRAVIDTALTVEGVVGLAQAGPRTAIGALAMPLMQIGLARGTIRFNLLTATKPPLDE
mmetsp:Transcript_15106/g.49547  ORF Transcript_15106/g.49547 Transcript_15106/m.49547 type:complete len:335 (-) Transcript_15106:137-1141(-)